MKTSTKLRRVRKVVTQKIPERRLTVEASRLGVAAKESLKRKGIKNPGQLAIINEAEKIVNNARKGTLK